MSKLADHLAALDHAVSVNPDNTIRINDVARLRGKVDHLARASAIGAGEAQSVARWLLWEIAQASGIHPASINDLYLARGRGETPTNYTIPAMNLRALSFDSARAVFRAASARDVGAMIFEIARSEIGYTDQRPSEYTSSVLAAAIKESFTGPVFIQGDHFQISARRYASDPDKELNAVRDLTREAIAAGFYNIDVDTSTLVDLDLETLAEQQRLNATLCAELTHLIRELEPEDITISVGGEIGEVGGKNSTEPELRAFMDEYSAALGGDGIAGLSKISIQTGTSHGGVVLPDGTMAKIKVDFNALAHLSRVAREVYHMAGAVQHGASTLPEEAFSKFAEAEACEVHLATNFQNMMYDRLPEDLCQEIYAWVAETQGSQRKKGETEEQFLYKNRKRAIGQFKREIWGLPEGTLGEICAAWEEQFGNLFERLNVVNTRELVAQTVKPVVIHKQLSDYGSAEIEEEDTSDLAD